MNKYILDDNNNPILEPDLLKWGLWFEKGNHVVAQDDFDDVKVSTVFLGSDHSFSREPHSPILWETMIFGGEHDEYQKRYSNFEDAKKGHQSAIDLVKGLKP